MPKALGILMLGTTRVRSRRGELTVFSRRRVLNFLVRLYCCSLPLRRLCYGLIGRIPRSQARRKPGEDTGQGMYTDSVQAQSLICLTLVRKELACPRGFFTLRRHYVAQTHSSIGGHAGLGWGNELEDGGRLPRERRRDHGKRRSASASSPLEVVQHGRGEVVVSTSTVDQGAMKRIG